MWKSGSCFKIIDVTATVIIIVNGIFKSIISLLTKNRKTIPKSKSNFDISPIEPPIFPKNRSL